MAKLITIITNESPPIRRGKPVTGVVPPLHRGVPSSDGLLLYIVLASAIDIAIGKIAV